MNITVGQQIANGQIVVASLNSNGSFRIVFPFIIFPGVNPEPFGLDVDPNVTVAALEDLLNTLLGVIKTS